ncbi:hypothetical protein Btru_075508 [Bulinus truncatus]|nr:hypothetical protein Btru_075508 [Bulinus truncatus]
MPARIAQDLKDRRAIYERLQTCIDPLNSGDHPISLWNDYECHLPDGFHSSISKVVTMADRKKAEAMGSGISYDTELIYSRVIGLMPSRDLQIRDIFKHELASVPPSMFDDSGNMRITKSKSVLKQKLQVEHSARNSPAPHVVVVDGCALLWIIHWPVNGTLQDFVDGFIMYIMKILTQHDVYVVFDRYFQYSIKSVTRSGRAAKSATRQHKLNQLCPYSHRKSFSQ